MAICSEVQRLVLDYIDGNKNVYTGTGNSAPAELLRVAHYFLMPARAFCGNMLAMSPGVSVSRTRASIFAWDDVGDKIYGCPKGATYLLCGIIETADESVEVGVRAFLLCLPFHKPHFPV